MSSVSREIVFYRVAWAVVGAALVAACTFGAVTVGSTLSAKPSVAASIPKATANMLKPLVATSAADSLDSLVKQVCATSNAPTHTIESGTGKTITIHC